MRNEEEASGGTGTKRNEPERRRRGSARAIDWSSTRGFQPHTAGDGPLVAGPILWHAPMGGECHKIGAGARERARPTHRRNPRGRSCSFSGDMVSWSRFGAGESRGEVTKSRESRKRMKARPYFLAFEVSPGDLFEKCLFFEDLCTDSYATCLANRW